MRKVVLGLGISLDGYIARPDGAVDFLFMPKDYSMGSFFAASAKAGAADFLAFSRLIGNP